MILPLLLALSPLQLTPPQAPADPLACVPADAVLAISITELDSLRADGRENAWVRLLLDEAFDPTWEVLRQSEGWTQGFNDNETGVDPLELLASIHNSLTVFLVEAPPDSPDNYTGGLVIDPGADRAEFELLLAELVASKVDDSVFSSETHAGAELVLMEDVKRQEAVLVVRLDWLVILLSGRSGQALQEAGRSAVDRFGARGTSPSLASSPLLAEARSGDTAPGRMEFFLNTHALMSAAPAEGLEDFEDEDSQAVLRALGLSQMTWVHAWMDLGAGERSDFELSLRLPDEGYVRTWASFFQPAPVHLAALIPEDSSSVQVFGYDLWALYQSIWDLVEEVFPEQYEQARMQLDGLGQAIGGVDLEQDLLAQFTGAVASFTMTVSEDEWRAAQPDLLEILAGEVTPDLLYGQAVLVELRDGDLLELTIEDLMGFAGMAGGFDPMEIEFEDFAGREIQSLELPFGGVLHWCFDDDLLVVSTFPTTVRAVLSLREAEGLGSALQDETLAPFFEREAQAASIGLADSRQLARIMFGSLELMQSILKGGAALEADRDDMQEPEADEWQLADLPLPAAGVADRYLAGTMLSTLRVEGSVFTLRYATR